MQKLDLSWLMITFITCNSNLVPLLEGVCSSNPCSIEFSIFWVFDLRHLIDSCCYLYSIRHSLVALLEALLAGIKGIIHHDPSGILEFATAAHDSDLRAKKELFSISFTQINQYFHDIHWKIYSMRTRWGCGKGGVEEWVWKFCTSAPRLSGCPGYPHGIFLNFMFVIKHHAHRTKTCSDGPESTINLEFRIRFKYLPMYRFESSWYAIITHLMR